MDKYVGLTAAFLRGCWAIPIAIAVFFVSRAIGAGGLYLSGVYFCAFSAYCLANFARCREAHCIVTGLGWGALGVIALIAGGLRLDWLGPIWNTFVIVAIVGHGFEIIWAATRHTHALRV